MESLERLTHILMKGLTSGYAKTVRSSNVRSGAKAPL
jgi:hypothetical protein